MTQCDMIYAFMEAEGSITQRQALRFCGCARLASRIHDLKKAGHNIISERVKVQMKDGTTAFVARYSLFPEVNSEC